MKKITVLFLLAVLSVSTSFSQTTDDKLPQNAKLISQSCTANSLFVSLIDLENNELVIVRYGIDPDLKMVPDYRLSQVFRTGIKIDPQIQNFIKGEDSSDNNALKNDND